MLTLTRALPTAALAVSLIVTPAFAANPLNALKSIRALEGYVELMDGSKVWMPVCTAWRAQTPQGAAWVTAGHCLSSAAGRPMRIGTVPVRPRKFVFSTEADGIDIGVLAGGPSAPPLALAFSSPSAFTRIFIAGHPHGSDVLHIAEGIVGGITTEDGLTLYNVAVMGGISGAPVIDKGTNVVVGMLTQSECPQGWCPMARGVTIENLRAYLIDQPF